MENKKLLKAALLLLVPFMFLSFLSIEFLKEIYLDSNAVITRDKVGLLMLDAAVFTLIIIIGTSILIYINKKNKLIDEDGNN